MVNAEFNPYPSQVGFEKTGTSQFVPRFLLVLTAVAPQSGRPAGPAGLGCWNSIAKNDLTNKTIGFIFVLIGIIADVLHV